jgi:uncharacterized membrane protein HdeD (DUF308 family)
MNFTQHQVWIRQSENDFRQYGMKLFKHWSVNLIRGLGAILLAILLLINGQQSIQRFTQFLGIFWLIIGLTYLINAREDRRLKPMMLILGVLTIFGGLVALSWPLLISQFDLSTLTILAGTLILTLGLLHIFAGYPAGSILGRKRDWGSLILGLLEIALGISALTSPGRLTTAAITVSIFFSVIFGLVLLFEAYRLWKSDS